MKFRQYISSCNPNVDILLRSFSPSALIESLDVFRSFLK